MILAGDIGGTKTILALYEHSSDWVCYRKEIFSSADFFSFSNLLEAFLGAEADLVIQSVCIGVAGPVVNGDCMATNLPWLLKRKEIAVKTGAKHVYLLNDLEATAWGVLNLSEDSFVELNPDAKENPGNKAVLAAGTGLGEAMVIWSNGMHHVVATEGGHADFAPRNELEIGLLRYLMGVYSQHVSYERVICGQGLVNIYQYLKSQQYAHVDSELELQMSESDPAAIISENAVVGGDPLCIKALEVFCEIYGAEAGNLALKCLPKAGVILAGGIAAKILQAMQNGDFMRGFLAKGRYKTVLKDISVKVCLNSEAALLGAATVAKQNENRCT